MCGWQRPAGRARRLCWGTAGALAGIGEGREERNMHCCAYCHGHNVRARWPVRADQDPSWLCHDCGSILMYRQKTSSADGAEIIVYRPSTASTNAGGSY